MPSLIGCIEKATRSCREIPRSTAGGLEMGWGQSAQAVAWDATRYDKRAGNYRAAVVLAACCGGWMTDEQRP
jgi:hypothetical protein